MYKQLYKHSSAIMATMWSVVKWLIMIATDNLMDALI